MNKNTRTNYSALIPAYNAAGTIGETIASILAQMIKPEEIIVIDDGSTDDTGRIAAACSPLVRVVRQENMGVGAATTRGFEEIKTPLLASVDADDIWLPEKIAIQIAHLEANPDCRGVFTHLRTFRDDGIDQGTGLESPGWSRSTLMMYTDAARGVGPVIDPHGDRGEMVDWIGRARGMGLRMDMLNDVLALRRIRPGSLSYGRDPEKDKGYLQVAWLAMQRRKAKDS